MSEYEDNNQYANRRSRNADGAESDARAAARARLAARAARNGYGNVSQDSARAGSQRYAASSEAGRRTTRSASAQRAAADAQSYSRSASRYNAANAQAQERASEQRARSAQQYADGQQRARSSQARPNGQRTRAQQSRNAQAGVPANMPSPGPTYIAPSRSKRRVKASRASRNAAQIATPYTTRSVSPTAQRKSKAYRKNVYSQMSQLSSDTYKRSSRLPLVTIVVAALILAAVAAIYFTQCAGKENPLNFLPKSSSAPAAVTMASASSSAQSGEAASDAAEPVESPDGAQLQVEELTEILGEEDANELLAQAETSADAYWIASHLDQYEFEGETVEWKMLKLAADEPTALKYVREFPEKYPQDAADLSSELAMDDSYLAGTKFDTGVPHLYQWDRRWGQVIYSSTAFGLTGCGPACMAMIYQGLTGATDLDPYDMAVRAEEGGYMATYEGTATSFFFDEAARDGLYCEQIDISADSIRSSLNSGQLIIANLGEGYFTRFGHFFVLVGVDENGDIIINDPYSEVRSTQTWDAELIASESKALFAFGTAY